MVQAVQANIYEELGLLVAKSEELAGLLLHNANLGVPHVQHFC